MSFEYTIYGDVSFNLSYTDQELEDKILSFIQSKESEESFSYLSLCRFIIEAAHQEERLKGAKREVYYQSPQLQPTEYTRISRLLWKFILAGKIFVDFYNNEYVAPATGDTILGIIADPSL